MRAFRLITSFLAILSLFACKKESKKENEPQFETQITGIVTHGNNNGQVMKDVKVYLYYDETPLLRKKKDSVLTDQNGVYNIILKTADTLDSKYTWRIVFESKYYHNASYDNVKLGRKNTRHAVAYEAGILRARVIYNNLVNGPMRVSTSASIPNFTGNLSFIDLTKTNADTTISLKLIPNKQNDINFYYPVNYTGLFRWWYTKPNIAPSLDTTYQTFNLDLNNFFTGGK